MKVMPRRGRPKRPNSTAHSIEASPPAAKTRPRSNAEPLHPLLDDPRQQHLDRAHEEQVGQRGAGEGRPQPRVAADEAPPFAQIGDKRSCDVAARWVPLPQVGEHRVALRHLPIPRAPAPSAARSRPPSGTSRSPARTRRRRPRRRRARRPAPARRAAARAVASAGPARWPASSRSPSRISGTSASKAGAWNAAPVPYSAARTTTCHSSTWPPIVSPARSAPAPPPAAGRRRPAASAARSDRWPRHRSAGT